MRPQIPACNRRRAPAYPLARLAILTWGLVLCGVLPACQKADATADKTAHELWEVFYLENSKIGYAQTTVDKVERDGRELLATDSRSHLAISRFGQSAEQDLRMKTWETPDGRLVEFQTELSSGQAPAVVTGRVQQGQMIVEIDTKGRRETSRVPWSAEIRGFRAVEQSLEDRPIAPHEKREFKMLMPLVNQVADVELVAQDYETTSVLGVDTRLLRIESIASLPGGQKLNSTLWADKNGQTIKTRIEAMRQESFRTTRELALAADHGGAKFDLGSDLIVPLATPLTDPHRTRQVRYRVELTDGDPAEIFASGVTQSVRSLGDHAAEVTVRSLRPGDLSAAAPATQVVSNEYLAANSVLQIDDPRIRQMAQEAKGQATGPLDVALALESYVHRVMTKKNFSQAFSTAAEVAESREGDCTEHAVLLAALARACGIPSRVAIGLVFIESAGGFGYHMWTEVFAAGKWIPLDATLGQGGIGAAHLKLTDSSLDGASAYSSFLPVANVVGQLKISTLAVE